MAKPVARPSFWAADRADLCATNALYYSFHTGVLTTDSNSHIKGILINDPCPYIATDGSVIIYCIVRAKNADKGWKGRCKAAQGNIEKGIALGVVVSKKCPQLPVSMEAPAMYGELGHYKVTKVWKEVSDSSKGDIFIKLVRVDPSQQSWLPTLDLMDTDVTSQELPEETCEHCDETSQQIKSGGWFCLNLECSEAGKIQHHGDDSDYLDSFTHATAEELAITVEAPSMHRPPVHQGSHPTDYYKGWVCAPCGRMLVRRFRRGWICPCGNSSLQTPTFSPLTTRRDHPTENITSFASLKALSNHNSAKYVNMVSVPMVDSHLDVNWLTLLFKVGDGAFFCVRYPRAPVQSGHDHVYSKYMDIVNEESMVFQRLGFSQKKAAVQESPSDDSETPEIETAETTTSEADMGQAGPSTGSDLPATLPTNARPLSDHFTSYNFGAKYDYSQRIQNRPLRAAPQVVKDTLEEISKTTRSLLQRYSGLDPLFQEILDQQNTKSEVRVRDNGPKLLYNETQCNEYWPSCSIGWHHDGQDDLEPLVGVKNWGDPAPFKIGIKNLIWVGRQKSKGGQPGEPIKPDPCPAGCEHYIERLQLRTSLDQGEIDEPEYDRRRREILGTFNERKKPQVMFQVPLCHGSEMYMFGKNFQKYWEHSLDFGFEEDPIHRDRIIQTCRWINSVTNDTNKRPVPGNGNDEDGKGDEDPAPKRKKPNPASQPKPPAKEKGSSSSSKKPGKGKGTSSRSKTPGKGKRSVTSVGPF